MSSLSGKDGPRIRHDAGASQPYETIGVDKLTPIIGAEIDGVDLAKPLSQPDSGRDPPRAGREHRDLLPRPAHHAAAASRLRPAVRRAARPSGRAARAGRAGADENLRRQEQPARERRGLAHRRVLRPRAADGQHPLYQAMPAAAAATHCSPACTPPTTRCRTA